MSNKFYALLALIFAVIVFLLMAQTKPALADGYNTRANACRTFHVFAHEKSTEKQAETDGLFCGNSQQNKPKDNPTITSVPTLNPPAVVIVVTPPANNPPQSESCDGGNPGNIKCVGNAGENPNGAGTMPQDNAGGNGNGEHGNQGVGGNH